MKQLISDIKNHDFKKVYLLYGNEDYLVRFYLNRLIDSNILPEDKFMNLCTLTEEEADVDRIQQSADTYPLMGEKRITWIRYSGWFSGKRGGAEDTERLSRILDNLLDTSMVIFEEDQVDKRSALYRTVSKTGYAAELNTLEEADMIRFVARMLVPYGKKIAEKTARYFLETIGGDMIHMQLELGKAASYAGDRPVLTEADIDAVCTSEPETDIFKMTESLGSRNRAEAIRIYEHLLAVNEPPQRIFYLLAQQIRKIYRVKLATEARMEKEKAASFAGVSPRALWAWEKQEKKFQKNHLEYLLDYMTQQDEKMKTGGLDARDGVLQLISQC